VPSLSCGVYTLPAGSKDLQNPHDEDEVYFVIDGLARVRVGTEEREVKRGSILYVGGSAEHSFIEIEEDMTRCWCSSRAVGLLRSRCRWVEAFGAARAPTGL
jgi:quercetin dioxygenase-like cupin family protein